MDRTQIVETYAWYNELRLELQQLRFAGGRYYLPGFISVPVTSGEQLADLVERQDEILATLGISRAFGAMFEDFCKNERRCMGRNFEGRQCRWKLHDVSERNAAGVELTDLFCRFHKHMANEVLAAYHKLVQGRDSAEQEEQEEELVLAR